MAECDRTYVRYVLVVDESRKRIKIQIEIVQQSISFSAQSNFLLIQIIGEA